MDLSFPSLLAAARHTVTDPRNAARNVMSLNLPLPVALMALLLTSVLSAIMAHVSFALLPASAQAGFENMMASPLRTAVVQVMVAFAGAFAAQTLGRWRGGHGTMPQTVALLAWLQFVMLILQVVQIAAEIVLPPFAFVLAYVSVGLFLWLLVHFVMELHGFRSAAATTFGILGTMVLLGFFTALLIAPFMPNPAGM
jgi:Yip1 domain